MMMVPEAWGAKFQMGADKRAFYEYHSAIMEPWDGPAALVFADGRYIGATLDRNGLRPCRYTVTRDGYVVLASETGVLDFEADRILRLGRLQPGKMLLVDLQQGRIVPDTEIKGNISRQKPYRRWVKDNVIELRGLLTPAEIPPEHPETLRAQQRAFGYTEEELRMVVGPMASCGQEAIGSMGNDAALAVLSRRPQLLFAYFKQLFAQVTNPPIDPLREELVMSLMGFIGPERNLLAETPQHCRRLKLHHPILTTEDMARLRTTRHPDVVARDIDILFPAEGDGRALEAALAEVFHQAEDAIAQGATVLILTDRRLDRDRAAIPALLATAGLHHHLTRAGLRTRAGIVVETGEAREVMHLALLIGYGANAVCPYAALSTAIWMADENRLETPTLPERVESAEHSRIVLRVEFGRLELGGFGFRLDQSPQPINPPFTTRLSPNHAFSGAAYPALPSLRVCAQALIFEIEPGVDPVFRECEDRVEVREVQPLTVSCFEQNVDGGIGLVIVAPITSGIRHPSAHKTDDAHGAPPQVATANSPAHLPRRRGRDPCHEPAGRCHVEHEQAADVHAVGLKLSSTGYKVRARQAPAPQCSGHIDVGKNAILYLKRAFLYEGLVPDSQNLHAHPVGAWRIAPRKCRAIRTWRARWLPLSRPLAFLQFPLMGAFGGLQTLALGKCRGVNPVLFHLGLDQRPDHGVVLFACPLALLKPGRRICWLRRVARAGPKELNAKDQDHNHSQGNQAQAFHGIPPFLCSRSAAHEHDQDAGRRHGLNHTREGQYL